MNKKYLIIDTYNLFYRSLYIINERNQELYKGLFLHNMFSMIKDACCKINPDCIIAVRDGNSSWRKKEYPAYKANRIDRIKNMTFYEQEKFQILKEVFENDFLPFIDNNTNVPLLSFKYAEADDLIARFINLHKDNTNIILSTDNDFIQLLNDNVYIYNSLDNRLITNKFILNLTNKKPLDFKLCDGKIKILKEQPKKLESLIPSDDWVDYALFMKCIRGDKSDNIMSAYPGVREKSTKKSIGIREAFEDKGGIKWNLFMKQNWLDPVGNKHIVEEEYNKNKKIIDLNEIPNEFKEEIDKYILEKVNQPMKKCIGIYLMNYFNKWNLVNINKSLETFAQYFQKGYSNG